MRVQQIVKAISWVKRCSSFCSCFLTDVRFFLNLRFLRSLRNSPGNIFLSGADQSKLESLSWTFYFFPSPTVSQTFYLYAVYNKTLYLAIFPALERASQKGRDDRSTYSTIPSVELELLHQLCRMFWVLQIYPQGFPRNNTFSNMRY